MNEKQVDDLDRQRLAAVAPWVTSANSRIDLQVADARAHAERALNQTLADAEHGRQTYRLLSFQNSHRAANERLYDLCRYLVGPSPDSIVGHVQDARADFYRLAFRDFAVMLPPKIRYDRAAPEPSGEKTMRGLALHGLTARQEIEPIFISAKNSLKTVLNAAIQQPSTAAEKLDLLAGWETRTAATIKQRIMQLLSDSEVAIWTLVGRFCIRPDLRSKTAVNAV